MVFTLHESNGREHGVASIEFDAYPAPVQWFGDGAAGVETGRDVYDQVVGIGERAFG